MASELSTRPPLTLDYSPNALESELSLHPETEHSLQINGLHKSFGEREVLKNLDLSIPEGAFVAVIGQSGCGKSTLLRLIAGLEEPTDGEIQLDGETVTGLNPAVRVMFQEPRLLPWKKVIDNVTIGLPKEARSRGLQLLESVGLGDRAGDWPAILSGGQRQRVALARALAGNPRFMLLDEPLGALDALTRYEMQLLLEQIWRRHKFTAMLITHDVEEAVSLADYVVVMDQGRIVLNLPVPLSRPRDHTDPLFVQLTARLLEEVRATARN